MMKKYFTYFIISLLSAAFFTACKKDSPTTSTETTTTIPTTGTTLDHIKDSVYLYTQEDYLWYDALPTYDVFKPRAFTGKTDVAALQSEVDALSQYKINSATSKPYEYDADYPGESKYSFIDQGEVSTSLGGTNGDFGFEPIWIATSDLRIKYVYPGSPADKAGLVRGYQIVKINGNSSLSYDYNSSTGTGTNYSYVVDAYYNSSTITLTLQKPDNTTFDVTLNTANYTVNPVLKSKVVDLGNGKKIGYLVFNSFTELKNAQSYLEAAFTTFATAGITDLVVDLRYNGGGAVETAEYLANVIVPTSKNGTLMYTYYFNDKLQNDKYPLLAKKFSIDVTKDPGEFKPENNQTNFTKSGTLNLSRVFFIVTGSTASASELTINNLIPEMNVQLIGTTTYGKPVGFFAIDIGTYELYVPEFETKNSASAGGYYSGMTPGSSTYPGVLAYDDVTRDFGDTSEGLLAQAIAYINTGSYTTTSALTTLSTAKGKQLSDDQVKHISEAFSRHEVKQLIDKQWKEH